MLAIAPPLAARRILIAEDEAELANVLAAFLVKAGAEVRIAPDGESATRIIAQWLPDLLLLDVRMPHKDGLSVLAEQRGRDRDALPIIIVSALSDSVDRLLGFRLGADDYIAKPFDPHEVLARVQAVLRRVQSSAHQALARPQIMLGSLRIDVHERRVSVAGQVLNLTPSEFRLLALMANRPGCLYSRAELCEYALNEAASDRGIDVHISRLRAKLLPFLPIQLTAVRGEGYRLELA
jgi:DNA-binding response OmpR family regulator